MKGTQSERCELLASIKSNVLLGVYGIYRAAPRMIMEVRACRRSQARMSMEVRADNLSILKKCNKSGTMKIRFGRWRSIGLRTNDSYI